MSITLLKKLELSDSNLSEFDSTKYYNKGFYNDDIYEILLDKNKLTSIKITNFVNLKRLFLDNNENLETIEIDYCLNLFVLDISKCPKLKDIKGLDKIQLQMLSCRDTNIDFLEEKFNVNMLIEKDNDKIHYIIDNIYLGDCGHDENELLELGISHVFNISPHTYRDYKQIIEFQLPIHDSLDQDITTVMPEILHEVRNLLDAGKKIYIHCYAGVSRSASLVILYIMVFYRKKFDDAFKFVREKRACIQPNSSFVKQLKSLEDTIINFKE